MLTAAKPSRWRPGRVNRSQPRRTGLTIRVSAGAGEGATELAAFDAALRSAGVGDFNLVRLSSVIPPGSVVSEVDAPDQLTGGHGDLLFCVYATAYANTPGTRAWAGLGWSEQRDRSGGGLFVEHTGTSRSEVERDLHLSLDELSRGRGGGFVATGSRFASAEWVAQPACAVVVATYRTWDWCLNDG